MRPMIANTFLTQCSDLCLTLSVFHFMIKAVTLLQLSKRKQLHPLYEGLGVWEPAVCQALH